MALVGERLFQWCRLMETHGLWKGSGIFSRMHGFGKGSCIQIPAGWVIRRPIELRKHDSDSEVFEQVFVECQYRGVWTAQRDPEWILDAGANVGLSALHFHDLYPRARIIALEPSPANFQQLLRNTGGISEIVSLNAALWEKEEPVIVANPASSGCAFQVQRASQTGTAVPGYTVEHLMRMYDTEKIDLLKIDIEGAEKVVFEASTEWLSKVGVIAIELHDHIRRGCSRAVFGALSGRDYRLRLAGENIVIHLEHPESGGRTSPRSGEN